MLIIMKRSLRKRKNLKILHSNIIQGLKAQMFNFKT